MRLPRVSGVKHRGRATPTHVSYRGRVRRVFGVVPAQHSGRKNRHYLLRYRAGAEPPGAHTVQVGPRGQRHVVGVLVRADHCRPVAVHIKATGRRGRPVIRKVRRAA